MVIIILKIIIILSIVMILIIVINFNNINNSNNNYFNSNIKKIELIILTRIQTIILMISCRRTCIKKVSLCKKIS